MLKLFSLRLFTVSSSCLDKRRLRKLREQTIRQNMQMKSWFRTKWKVVVAFDRPSLTPARETEKGYGLKDLPLKESRSPTAILKTHMMNGRSTWSAQSAVHAMTPLK